MKYQLVIFDMDGTLTEELLDYITLRDALGITSEGGILENISRMSAHDQAQARQILHQHEMVAAEKCRVLPGASELLDALRLRNIRTALLTRNSAASASTILNRHNLTLDHISTRENPPHKPHADSILNITRRWNIPPNQTLMVGDYLYDLQAAHAAGADSALLCKRSLPRPHFAAMATRCIDNLSEILPMIEENKPAI